MTYNVEISSTAKRLVKKFPRNIREEIVKHSKIIASNPSVGEKLRGKHSFLFSYHFGFKGVQYRMIYEISQEKKIIYIRLATTRENIYRRLEEMNVKPLLH